MTTKITVTYNNTFLFGLADLRDTLQKQVAEKHPGFVLEFKFDEASQVNVFDSKDEKLVASLEDLVHELEGNINR